MHRATFFIIFNYKFFATSARKLQQSLKKSKTKNLKNVYKLMSRA